jgi:DNA-binding transcriptional ArsR family regulator
MSRADELSQDEVFEVLKSPRRRYALYYLRQEGGETELSDLTEQVAAWENETTPSALSTEQRKRVYISLYQTHLPKLDGADIVEYDRDEGIVRLGDRASDLDLYLGDVSRDEFPWDRYYLSLVAASSLLVAAVWLDIYPFGLIPGLVLATLILVVFGVSAILHYLNYRHGGEVGTPPELHHVNGQEN